ncbi:amidohydrolase family protein [Oscillibacter sp. MSJ-2]|uniref:Amidohydrolase family protein n=1 Tax=Dysosmobacter acutus TaxID=2841504 RepID=A0ABS6FCF0_9FIRM|nr:amidohydrolase family protein [Dysosmobacter acutus]MBU5627963.1 amidohydrolase family protein [Dysosmobacter acutus]
MAQCFLKQARIVDGTGANAVEDGILVYEKPEGKRRDGKILYAGKEAGCPFQPQSGDEVMDLPGYTLLPGLFNVHTHLYSMDSGGYETPSLTLLYFRHLAESLFAGVTTVRTVGGSDNIDVCLRDAIQAGMVWGPRLITCGSPILPHGGHCFRTRGGVCCSGPDEFVRAARTEMSRGVDQIKLYYSGGAGGTAREGMFNKHILDAEGQAVCEVSHMNGKIVSAHLSNDAAVRSAVRCGVDSVEHAYRIDRETARMMAEHNVFYVPTLTITDVESFEEYSEILSKGVTERLAAAHPAHMESARYAVEAGVKKICTGTDTLPSDRFGGTFAITHEVELLTQVGLTPLEAIRAATATSAELCGVEGETGALKAGLAGDILAVRGKPDQRISDLRNLEMVIHECRTVWSKVPGFEKEKAFWPGVPGETEPMGLGVNWSVE